MIPACGRKGPPVWLEPEELPAPSNINARFGPDGTSLSWDFPPELAEYLGGFVVEIYKGGALIDSHVTFKGHFADFRVGPYAYRIAPLGKRKGSRGIFSPGVRRPETGGLTAPQGLSGIMTTKGFLIEWSGEGPLYEISRLINAPGGGMEGLIIPDAAYYIDREFAPVGGEVYVYKVRSIMRVSSDEALVVTMGPWSEAFYADSTLVVPETPRGQDITTYEGSVLIYWNENPEKWIRGYRIYRAHAGGEFLPLAETPTPAYKDIPGSEGTFAYRVTALGPGEAESPPGPPVRVSLPSGTVIK